MNKKSMTVNKGVKCKLNYLILQYLNVILVTCTIIQLINLLLLAHPLERVPLLFVDVNLGVRSERIVIFEGDDTGQLAHEFASSHCKYELTNNIKIKLFFIELDSVMESKLKDLLDNQLASLLLKIEEEGEDYHADNE